MAFRVPDRSGGLWRNVQGVLRRAAQCATHLSPKHKSMHNLILFFHLAAAVFWMGGMAFMVLALWFCKCVRW